MTGDGSALTRAPAEGRYRTVVADPPWAHSDGFIRGVATGKTVGKGRPSPLVKRTIGYPTLSTNEIANLAVSEWCESSCRLFLWATNRYLPDALSEVVPAWGFRYRQTLVWHKPDVPFGGSVAPNAEFLVVATKGTPRLTGRASSAVITYARRQLKHSQKPECFLDLVEQVSPGPYLEMFARRQRLGWDTYGNEALNHVEIAS